MPAETLNEIPDAARWTGPPGPLVIQAIAALTYIDFDGRRFYRRALTQPWRHLRSPEDFADLNAVIERYRCDGAEP